MIKLFFYVFADAEMRYCKNKVNKNHSLKRKPFLQNVEILERRLSLRVPQEHIFTITRFLQKAMP